MKKIALVLGVIAAAFILAGCASKAKEQPAADANNSAQAAPAHHDWKGEKI